MSEQTNTQRDAILEQALQLAPFEGWTQSMLYAAEDAADLPHGAGALYFPNGVLGVIQYWSEQLNAKAEAEIKTMDLAAMKIRERVTAGVLARLRAMDAHTDAARRAASRLMLPDAAAQGASQIWSSADMIWRAIGDTSTDGNFYSKRATLSAVIAAAAPVWLGDDSDDKAQGRAFLDARIENVMQFESFKWKLKTRTKDWPNPAQLLGKLRYGDAKSFGEAGYVKPPFKRRRRRSSRTL